MTVESAAALAQKVRERLEWAKSRTITGTPEYAALREAEAALASLVRRAEQTDRAYHLVDGLERADEALRQMKIIAEAATIDEHPGVLPNKIASHVHVERMHIAAALARFRSSE